MHSPGANTLGCFLVTILCGFLVNHGSSIAAPSRPCDSKIMRGHVVNELYVELPAKDIWSVYSSPELPRLITNILPVFKKSDIIEGDGRVGTVLDIELAEGQPEPRIWKEKFLKIDDRTREKVVRQIEGGYLDLGFYFYQENFKVIEKDAHSCIIRSTTAFELDRQFDSNASLITASSQWALAKGVANYTMQLKLEN